jgi:hypothetical protein
MEAWRVYRLMVEDSQHFDEEQDADPNPDPHEVKSWIQIRVKVKS